MEDTPGGNNSAIERAKKFVSDLAKRVKSSDSKVHETLTTKAVGSDQITDTRAPHFVIDDIIMPIFFEEDELFSFPIHGSVEVPEFVPAMTLENSLDLTYVTELNESGYKTDASGFPGYKTDASGFPGYKTDASGFPGYKTDASGFPGYKTDANGFPGYKADASARLSLNSTDEKLDSDYSTTHYDDQFCSFSCISPASFNLNPTSSLYADRCIADTCVDDGRSWSQQSCSSDELDSFFDVSVLQNEQCSTYVKRTVV